MHKASVGEPAQVAWHCCCCGGASHRATQLELAHSPGSRVPFFKLTSAATSISLGLPFESLRASFIACRPCGCLAPAEPAWTASPSHWLNWAAVVSRRRSTRAGAPAAWRSWPASSGKSRTHAEVLQAYPLAPQSLEHWAAAL